MTSTADDIAISVRNLTKTYRRCDYPGEWIMHIATFVAHKATFVA